MNTATKNMPLTLPEAVKEIDFLRGQLAAYGMQWEAMLRTLADSGDLDRILSLLHENNNNKNVPAGTKLIRH